MKHFETTETGQKAFRINLDATKHGTFAEIGAGQEVARWFFRVGGAAGTVSKSISAYDKTVSDAIYGPSDRYVSRHRLQQMLDYEFNLLVERLDASRGAETTFFVFADTVAARSYTRRDDSHGWLGMKFQTHPRTDPSQVMIHVRLLDDENVRQQEALGVIGVNLIYGAFVAPDQPERLINSLLDQLTRTRIEVDMIEFSGPGFANIDNRLISLQLVEQGLTEAVMFTVDGHVVQPSEVLYKKPVLVERGTFRPVNCLHVDMLENARHQFFCDLSQKGDVIELMEITMRNLLDSHKKVDPVDFLARVDTLRSLGKTVLVTSHGEFYHTVEYLRRSTKNAIGFAIGLPTLQEILEEKYYDNLNGGILEALGRIFEGAVKFYVYPRRGGGSDSIITSKNMPVPPQIEHLVAHLRENRLIEDLQGIKSEYLDIHSNELLKSIRAGDPGWEAKVPAAVAEIIKTRKYFG
ncbi:MAG TPA: TonB-dependent receptor [Verrucomicrobiae bacterium]|nr:TonB-dependent receptor [Verrucomicrobiae bacterium]